MWMRGMVLVREIPLSCCSPIILYMRFESFHRNTTDQSPAIERTEIQWLLSSPCTMSRDPNPFFVHPLHDEQKAEKKHYIRYLPIVQIVPDMFCIFLSFACSWDCNQDSTQACTCPPSQRWYHSSSPAWIQRFWTGLSNRTKWSNWVGQIKKKLSFKPVAKTGCTAKFNRPNSTDPDPRAKSLPAIVKPKRTSNQKPWRCLKNKCTLEFLMGKMSKLKM